MDNEGDEKLQRQAAFDLCRKKAQGKKRNLGRRNKRIRTQREQQFRLHLLDDFDDGNYGKHCQKLGILCSEVRICQAIGKPDEKCAAEQFSEQLHAGGK